MALSLFLVSSCWPSTHPIISSITIKYNIFLVYEEQVEVGYVSIA